MATETTLQNLINQYLRLPEQSVTEALETYSHIELTKQEELAAILAAKKIVFDRQEHEKRQAEIERARRLLTKTTFSFEQLKGFILHRIAKEGIPFILDEQAEPVFNFLLSYFTDSEKEFELYGGQVPHFGNLKLSKGILLVGDYGVGKSLIMNLFGRNTKQCFQNVSAKYISEEWKRTGTTAIFEENHKLPVNDLIHFGQPELGLCIDDLGAESEKNSFGNRSNVIGDLIETRYNSGVWGKCLHGTTNLDAEGLKSFYGPRVTSRMKEIFNIIVYKGKDRRG